MRQSPAVPKGVGVTRLAAILTMGLLLALAASQPAQPKGGGPKKPTFKTLRHKQTGFAVRAPKGFRLQYKEGAYVISKGPARVVYVLLDTNASPAEAGSSFVEQMGATVVERSEGASSYTATVEREGQRQVVSVRKEGSKLATATYGIREGSTKKGKEVKASSAAVQAPSLDLLRQIADLAHGGQAAPLPRGTVQVPVAPIALKAYTAPDGKASGLVPAEDGWWFSGANGAIEGYKEKGQADGEFTLGLGALVAIPGTCALYPNVPCVESDFKNPDDALRQIWPKVRAFAPGSPISNIEIRETHPASLPGYLSAFYAFTYLHSGVPWNGVALVGTSNPGAGMYWIMYISTISVPATDDSSVAQALAKTWQSWDPTPAVEERLRNTQTTVRATAEMIQDVNAFRQRVFEKTSYNWDQYIRGGPLDLRPVHG